MGTRSPMAVGEWYHCYNRGVDKRVVFEEARDYERFLLHLYIANGTQNIRISNLTHPRLADVLANEKLERGDQLVELGAYTLMPSHPHLLIKEVRDGGIALFMQKVFTGYTMYFNNKYERTGALFAGTFKSKHIHDDAYLKRALPYVLMNAAELFEKRWKKGAGNPQLAEKLNNYPYSSLSDFVENRPNFIATTDWSQYYDRRPTLAHLLKEARTYYEEHADLQV